MNRQMWNTFLEQIDAQFDGDFLAIAKKYEEVTGHPFHVSEHRSVLFAMLEQAMMTQDHDLLKLTVKYTNHLPVEIQKEFRAFGRNRVTHHDSGKYQEPRFRRIKLMANKLWDFLQLKRTA